MSVSCQFHKLCCCCLLSRSLHRRACSHYEKYPLLHKISHTKLSWGEAAPMVVLSTLPIEKRHVAFFLLDCSSTSDTLPREFPLLASRTTFFFSFSPMFHFCCFKKNIIPYLDVKCCSIYKFHFVPVFFIFF